MRKSNARTLTAWALLGIGWAGHAAAQGGLAVPGLPESGPQRPLSEGLYWLEVPVEGEPLPEVGLLGIPPGGQGMGSRPLLVFYHSFSATPNQVTGTGFAAEAANRGWYLWSAGSRSPGNFRDVNYGSVESQVFTAAGIDFVLDTYPIDRTRIYGVGFSMGSAQCMSYAARHMDPSKGMFAALVNHSGSIDQSDTWRSLSSPPVLMIIESLFGGVPTQVPFAYRSASILELDEITGIWDPGGTHQAINLLQTPTQIWWAESDPNAYLVNQTEQHVDFLTANQAPAFEAFPVPVSSHEWDLLPYAEVCDWLEQQVLAIPLDGTVIADRNRRWLWFDVTGVQSGSFGTFSYSVDLPNQLIELRDTEGLDGIRTNLAQWNGGSSLPLPLTVKVGAQDVGDTIILRGVSSFPLIVTRDGAPQATGWSYDSFTQELTLTEVEAGPHSWVFLP